MAQWLGQYSGHNHKTRVEDCEEALRVAGAAFHSAAAAMRARKAKNVRAMAKRLLSARRHQLRSQLNDAEGASAGNAQSNEREISRLRARLDVLEHDGLDAVLAEFGLEAARGAG